MEGDMAQIFGWIVAVLCAAIFFLLAISPLILEKDKTGNA